MLKLLNPKEKKLSPIQELYRAEESQRLFEVAYKSACKWGELNPDLEMVVMAIPKYDLEERKKVLDQISNSLMKQAECYQK